MTPGFRNALTKWYAANRRSLPWRDRPSPYRVWISEIMLQQTRVETVREYFRRFLKRFPNIRALAESDEESVLQAWSGLGYYRRACMLHAAARRIIRLYGGRFPRDRASVLDLPGVGRYTTGAILSIAFNQPEPIVDGNVERVFARLHALGDSVKSKSGREFIWQVATEHVERGNAEGHKPGDLNQALMELGATVCKPEPECKACPVRRWCKAFKANDVDHYPVLPARAKPKPKRYLFAAVRDDAGRVLLVKRGRDDRSSLLPVGMWELPHAEWKGSMQKAWSMIETAHGLEVSITGKPASCRHAIMDYRLTLAVQPCTGVAANGTWFTLNEARNAAIASATRKLLDCLE